MNRSFFFQPSGSSKSSGSRTVRGPNKKLKEGIKYNIEAIKTHEYGDPCITHDRDYFSYPLDPHFASSPAQRPPHPTSSLPIPPLGRQRRVTSHLLASLSQTRESLVHPAREECAAGHARRLGRPQLGPLLSMAVAVGCANHHG